MAAGRGEYRQAAELTSQGLVGRSPMTDFDEPKDPSWLLAFDWVELNKLQRAYKDGGDDALEGACRELMNKDMPQFARIACAYMPDQMPQRPCSDTVQVKKHAKKCIGDDRLPQRARRFFVAHKRDAERPKDENSKDYPHPNHVQRSSAVRCPECVRLSR